MGDAEYSKMIHEILAVIESYGIDMVHAEEIPTILAGVIKNSNYEQACITKFKKYSKDDSQQ